MEKVTLAFEKDLIRAHVDKRLYSSFLEHLGRAIYTGIYEPKHPMADNHGFRKDVMDLIKELKISYIRYPGGNYVSGFDWKDGIGPLDKRPRRLDLAWHTIESNCFGIDEFVDWSRKAGTRIMGAVNMGTGTPKMRRNSWNTAISPVVHIGPIFAPKMVILSRIISSCGALAMRWMALGRFAT